MVNHVSNKVKNSDNTGILNHKKTRDKLIKIGFKILLVLYFIGLLYFLFFDPLLGRVGKFDFIDFKFLEFNLIPFKTIAEYIKSIFNIPYAYKMGYDTNALFLNLVGNFLCFAPLGILLPLSFENQKKTKFYLITTFLICFILETFQCISMNGSFDIDDIILNYSGAIITYLIVIKEIIPFIKKVLLSEENITNYKGLIIKGVIIICILILFIIGFKYRDSKELEFIHKISTPNITYKYTGYYIEDYQEVIYEDETMIYYLNHYKKEDVILIINYEEILLMDYMNEKTIYMPNIETLICVGVDVTRKEKRE